MAATRGCPFRCTCGGQAENGGGKHHICSAGTCSCYATDSHICGCSAMSCRRPGVTTPYNYVEIRKGYMYHADRPNKAAARASKPPSEMMSYANLNAWLRRITLMLQKEEEMRAPPTSWDQVLLEANDRSAAHRHSSTSPSSSSTTSASSPSLLLPRRHYPPLTDRRKFAISWEQNNCLLHLVYLVESSRSSIACRLVEEHVHRRLTRHMLRHIVKVGRALPDDTEKSLYLEELLPATAATERSGRRHVNGGGGVDFPKRLKDATYADLLRVSTARLKSNAKQIAAKAAAAVGEDRGGMNGKRLGAAGGRKSPVRGGDSMGRKLPVSGVAAALAKSAFADLLVSTSASNRPSADVIDALEAAERELQEDAAQSGFTPVLANVRVQMTLHFKLLVLAPSLSSSCLLVSSFYQKSKRNGPELFMLLSCTFDETLEELTCPNAKNIHMPCSPLIAPFIAHMNSSDLLPDLTCLLLLHPLGSKAPRGACPC